VDHHDGLRVVASAPENSTSSAPSRCRELDAKSHPRLPGVVTGRDDWVAYGEDLARVVEMRRLGELRRSAPGDRVVSRDLRLLIDRESRESARVAVVADWLVERFTADAHLFDGRESGAG
jgi:hypothetical protein